MTDLSRAILETLVYADIFDQPLTLPELHRYLHGCAASPSEVNAALDGSLPVVRIGDLVALAGRECLAVRRAERTARARALWPHALRYGVQIARLPFVRMVAVTGALAVDSVDAEADVDYLVVAEPGRVWTCRLLTLAVVRLAARTGLALCPNYFLTTRSLALQDQSIFTARELTQMVPVSGGKVYNEMRALNRWADALLPNASGSPHPERLLDPPRRLQALENLLAGRLGDRLERWEMRRKTAKLGQRQPPSAEIRFDPDRVQGHTQGYRTRTITEFNRRLAALDQSL